MTRSRGDPGPSSARQPASARRSGTQNVPVSASQRSGEVQATESAATSRLPSLSEADTICNLKRRIAELEKDKKQLGRLADVEKEKCAAVEKRLAEAEGTITGLEASLKTFADKPYGQRTSDSETTRVQRLFKKAKRVGDEAEQTAKLPVFQREMVLRLKNRVVEMCKATIHQLDISILLKRGEAAHAWIPQPQSLYTADEMHANSEDSNVMRGAASLPGGKVPSPPMLCSDHKAMQGGLFGRTFVEPLSILLEFLGVLSWNAQRWEVVSASGEMKTFEDMTAADVNRERTVLSKSPVAGFLCKLVQNTISNQMSSLKSMVVQDFLQGLGYLAKTQRLDISTLGDDNCILQLIGRSLEDIGRELRTDDANIHEVIRPVHLRRWRVSSYLTVRATGCTGVGDLAFCAGHENTKDVLFKNGYARRSFVLWAGRQLGDDGALTGDTSLLSLARLDAWVVAYLIVTRRLAWEANLNSETQRESTEDGRAREVICSGIRPLSTAGTARNSFHNTLFERLLPIAIEGVLQEVRQVVLEELPDEVHMPFDFDAAQNMDAEEDIDRHPASRTPCSGPRGHNGELHNQAWRQGTSSHHSPFDGQDYVLATPKFVHDNACWWLGDVRDAFIGVCKPDKNDYEAIRCNHEDGARILGSDAASD